MDVEMTKYEMTRKYEYAIRIPRGGVVSRADNPEIIAALLQPGEELVRREVGDWETLGP